MAVQIVGFVCVCVRIVLANECAGC